MLSNRLFLYGTIKSDQPNHSFIPKEDPQRCRFLGTGKTETKWPLVIATKYNFPFLLDCEGEGYNVEGEVYEMDNGLLSYIDEKEGYPDHYARRQVNIVLDKMADDPEPNTSKTLRCWYYLLPRFSPSVLALEKYKSYDSYGAHGKQCIEVYDHKRKEWVEPIEKVHREIALLHGTDEKCN
nr:putative gamma-glutamylcyclotransferase CG2811 [Lytechinus pictus]